MSKTINGKYTKIKTLGRGGQGKVYLVEDKDKNQYIAKIMEPKQYKYLFEFCEKKSETEIKVKMLKKINKISSPYLLQFKEAEIGEIKKDDEIICKRTYYIFEYCNYGDLFRFILHPGDGLKESIFKLIFKKIVLGVKALHENGIYHRDLKLDNIVIDHLFNPKICDFDMCIESTKKLKDFVGTKNYKSPQKFEGKEYSGDKSDIFSLGCLLYYLIVREESFSSAEESDSKYILVKEKKKDSFFEQLKIESFNDDFKDLYFRMIAYEENERPTLDEILNSKWLDEINNLNEENMKKLEDEARTAIINISKEIDSFFRDHPYYLKRDDYGTSSENKGGEIDKKDYEKEYFKNNSEVKFIGIDLEGEIYIKINGEFDYWDYMNFYVNEIKNKEKCEISDYENSCYKCNIVYKENEKDDKEDLIIKLKLYTTGKEEYLLRFLKVSGGIFDYYEKVKIICSLGKELLEKKYILN